MQKKRVKIYFWLSAILLFILLVIWNITNYNKELKKNGIILNAQIIDIVHIYRGSPNFKYNFFYNNKIYIQEGGSGIRKKNLFIGKYFPVIFSPKSKNSELLISPEDFEKFDIPFPDSLKWVLKYRNN